MSKRQTEWTHSDFIWPFVRPYMGVIPNPKMAFIFQISCILAFIFPIFIKYFPKCEGKGSFLKSQIKPLTQIVLLLQEQSDLGPHYLSKRLQIF